MINQENLFYVNDVAIEIGDGSIIDNIVSAGFALPHSCLTGRCLSCQARLVSGDAENISDRNLINVEGGLIVTCQHRATPGLRLSCDKFDTIKLPPRSNSPAKIFALRQFDHTYCRVTLGLPMNKPFNVVPGQYINLVHDGCKRSYSVSGIDAALNHLELILARVAGGQMSDYIFNAATVGDMVRVVGPMGAFYLRENSSTRECVFIASGSGIGPILFMVKAARQRNPAFRYRVMWQMRDESTFTREILELLGPHCELILSRPKTGWGGLRGYVQDHLTSDVGSATRHYYLCGSPQMLSSVAARLHCMGVSESNLFSDPFLPSEP